MAIKLWKKIPVKIRRTFYFLLFWILSIVISYGSGTFQPNYLVLNKITKDAFAQVQSEYLDYGLYEPEMIYDTNEQFVTAVNKCISYVNLSTPPDERVHAHIIIAMAILETGYGNSRFAKEGNNLFGIRTWDEKAPQLKPKGNPDAKWGVKVYITKCKSVKDMIRIINELDVYKKFREERANQLATGTPNLGEMINHLSPWSTNPRYTRLVISKVNQIQELLSN